ncbi:MAG: extracellular solute-binding protein [Chloroflexi bacterium]|nr:extracellular solute-binding protein [Chloroflexota bacterium]
MNQRRFVVAVQRCGLCVVALFALFGLTACKLGAPPAATPVPSNSAQSPVTITFWHTQTGASRAQLNAFASDFKKVYPWITVRAEGKSNDGDLLRQGIAALALNQTPDFVIAGPRPIADFARREALVNLDSFLNDPSLGLSAEERGDLLPGALEIGRFPELGNRLYSFPFDARAVALYYNAGLLRAAKFNAPPRTWDEFGAAVRSATRNSVRGWVMWPDATVFYALLFSQGGSVLNDMQTGSQLGSAATLRLLQLIAALSKGDAGYLAASADSARDEFAQGNAAFWFGTTNDVSAVTVAVSKAGSNLEWGIATIPQQDPDRAVTVLFGENIAIFRTSPERERAAWLFARWLATPEQSARWSRVSFGIPVRLSAPSLLAADPPLGLPLASINNLINPLPTGRGIPTVKDAANIDAAIVELWTAVATGADPTAALSRTVQRVNRALGQTP